MRWVGEFFRFVSEDGIDDKYICADDNVLGASLRHMVANVLKNCNRAVLFDLPSKGFEILGRWLELRTMHGIRAR